jgi:hypothetical protein
MSGVILADARVGAERLLSTFWRAFQFIRPFVEAQGSAIVFGKRTGSRPIAQERWEKGRQMNAPLRSVLTRTLALALVALLFLVAAAACGGDDDDDGGDEGGATSAAATTPASGPGTITLSSTAISGQDGKVLLVFATSGQDRLARACVPITSDSFEVTGVVMSDVPEGNDPCGGETPETTFEEGDYSLSAGVYVGGQQTPDAETTLSVSVAGDVTAEIDGAELSQ